MRSVWSWLFPYVDFWSTSVTRGFQNINLSNCSLLKIVGHVRFEAALCLGVIFNVVVSKCLTFYFYSCHAFLQLHIVDINFLLRDTLVQGLGMTELRHPLAFIYCKSQEHKRGLKIPSMPFSSSLLN